MSNAKILYERILSELLPIYGQQEAQSISYRLMEDQFRIFKTDIVAGKEIKILDESLLNASIEELKKNTPIQYVVGRTEFHGLTFYVDSSVLIPRPETEELADRIIWENRSCKRLKILDVGTGSGCIAVTLAKFMNDARVYATDISENALQTAEKNAVTNGVDIFYQNHNILTEDMPWDSFDIIVSNPPYVLYSEKEAILPNVLKFEPHLALFVENEDPLLFYRIISEKAHKILKPGGKIYFEINERFGEQVKELLDAKFGDVRIIQDLQGKDRMVSARL